MRQVNLRVSEELLARVDRARGDVPRERWLRRVVEQALGGVEAAAGVEPRAPLGDVPDVAELPAPAEHSTVEQALGYSGMASDSGSATASRPDPAPAEQSLSRVELFRRATQR